jgi:beta-glucanase (GH16 family)
MKKAIILLALFAVLPLNGQDWELVWEDQFNGSSLDSTVWTIEEKVGIWNTGQNAEFQHYRRENVRVGDDGNGNNCLILTAKKENYKGYSYTSGKVVSQGKFAFRRGKLEAAIKIPDLANGLWPAFWTLGDNDLGWPNSGEIDIMEMGHSAAIARDTVNSYVGAHLFWGPYNGGFPNYGTGFTADQDLSQGYFIHTLVWDETRIRVYFNGAEDPYFVMNIGGAGLEEFRDHLHFILFNLAVGGSLPGVSDEAGITAPFPASMFVDWVRLYQEAGKTDYNDSTMEAFGTLGVYEEKESIDYYMNHGFDLVDSIYGLIPREENAPYEGEKALSFDVTSGQPFQLALRSVVPRNLSRYDQGSVQFYLKTDLSSELRIGVADTSGKVHFINLSDYEKFDLPGNGNWSLVYVPLADFLPQVDLGSMVDLLVLESTPDAEGFFSLDQVIYSPEVPASGYFGIYAEDENISLNFEIDNEHRHLYTWENSIAFNSAFEPYEGDEVLSFRSSGAQSWFGFGLYSDNPLNLENFADGYLNISIVTRSDAAFYIGMDAEGDSDAIINFSGSNDPYGFTRDGNWNHLSIPLSDLVSQGLDLSSVRHIFKTGGGGSIGNIAYDWIFLSEEEQTRPVGISSPWQETSQLKALSARSGHVMITGYDPGSTLYLYAADGRKMGQYLTLSDQLHIPISSLAPGIYLVSARKGKKVSTIKFIK